MTDFDYWQRLANLAGKVLCMICYEAKERSDMEPAADGKVWDVCRECYDYESRRDVHPTG